MMHSEKNNLEALKILSRQWKDRIAELLANAVDFDGEKKSDILSRIERLKQEHAIIEQYLKQAETEKDSPWDKKAAALNRMFGDIDRSYRKTLSYFH